MDRVGDFVDGRQEGLGVYIWRDGRVYEGGFARGRQHGTGVYTNLEGVRRCGRWENGRRVAWTDEQGRLVPESNPEAAVVSN